jgi:serine/threonine-protein phosphatase CPPED1
MATATNLIPFSAPRTAAAKETAFMLSQRSNIPRLLSRRILMAVCGLLLVAGPMPAANAQPFFFIQLTDPQFGMYANNADFVKETANFESAMATVNRLKPAFVVVTGDLVNKAGDKAQTDEYLRICGRLDPAIRLYHVAGNHDLDKDATPASVAAYAAKFGPDHFSFRHGRFAGIVLNSCLIRASGPAAQQRDEQEAWLRTELAKAKQEQARPIVVFQHHSLFLKKADEPDHYFNVLKESRARYLDLLQKHGVSHVFAGHYHGNEVARDGQFEMVTSGPIGKPLRKDQSGLRIVAVRDTGIEHRYYELGAIPNRIDPAVPLPAR